MKNIFISLLFCPLYIFANDIEVNGQFIIAPISSEKCEGSAVTVPTSELSSDSQLFEMITPFLITKDIPSDIEHVAIEEYNQNDIEIIYSLDGQKRSELKPGINIIVPSQGQARKISVK